MSKAQIFRFPPDLGRVRINNIEGLIVRGDGKPVRPLDGGLGEQALDCPVRVISIDGFNVHFQVRAVAVARVGKVDAPLGINGQIVRAVVAAALEAVRENGDLARVHVCTDHATPPAGTFFAPLAGDQIPVLVEHVAVRPSAVAAEDGEFARSRQLHNTIVANIAEEDVSLRIRRRTLGKGNSRRRAYLRRARDKTCRQGRLRRFQFFPRAGFFSGEP